MKSIYSLSPKTMCVISIVLLMQLDCISSRPLRRNQENQTIEKMQINQWKPLEEEESPVEKEITDSMPADVHRSINKTPVSPTQQTRSTNELKVLSPYKGQNSIDYDHQNGEDDATMSDQMLVEKYYETLRQEREIKEYVECFGSYGVPAEVLAKLKSKFAREINSQKWCNSIKEPVW